MATLSLQASPTARCVVGVECGCRSRQHQPVPSAPAQHARSSRHVWKRTDGGVVGPCVLFSLPCTASVAFVIGAARLVATHRTGGPLSQEPPRAQALQLPADGAGSLSLWQAMTVLTDCVGPVTLPRVTALVEAIVDGVKKAAPSRTFVDVAVRKALTAAVKVSGMERVQDCVSFVCGCWGSWPWWWRWVAGEGCTRGMVGWEER